MPHRDIEAPSEVIADMAEEGFGGPLNADYVGDPDRD
jgi:hypothetical protein